MSKHLTPIQISGLLSGAGSDATVEQHVRDCAACNAELSRFRDAMEQFRETVVVLAERADRSGPPSSETLAAGVRAPRLRPLRLSLAIAAGAVLLLPIYIVKTSREQPVPSTASSSSEVMSDDLILNAVESRLSRQVPSAFAPMMELMLQDWSEQQPKDRELEKE